MADLRPDRESTTGVPRWVKVIGIIALIVVLLVVVIMLTGGGLVGPGGHTPPEGGH
jgi:ABC-type transporter Mla subunit MlaD